MNYNYTTILLTCVCLPVEQLKQKQKGKRIKSKLREDVRFFNLPIKICELAANMRHNWLVANHPIMSDSH